MTHTEAGLAVTRHIDGAELPAPGRWQLDPGHTELAFIGRHTPPLEWARRTFEKRYE